MARTAYVGYSKKKPPVNDHDADDRKPVRAAKLAKMARKK